MAPIWVWFYKAKKQLELEQDVHLFPFWFASLLGMLYLRVVKRTKTFPIICNLPRKMKFYINNWEQFWK
jgi:hypothetical protein